MKKSKFNAKHYIWGDHCDGWYLVETNDLSIIQERMPPNTSEVRHFHQSSRQFFFILSGVATIEVNGGRVLLHPMEGIQIPPLAPHQIFNETEHDLEFNVTSQPNSKGDRILEK
ncbi:cupin domain-containing protein [Mesobacillus jeotgali]|uniref:Cupin domain-containing protein n=1 Tax=Mesobacillus jeotgali TaxID=129985 RepID=A0ABY9VFQ6_9BACI|nr:cupin domain-containing protein [Mesobacillus jeotgali]WNF22655.1 cupin domain-containing protein [Mesobacillus jeotgali]